MLHHVDLQSGAVRIFPRAETDDHAVLHMASLLDGGGGDLPGLPGWLVRAERPSLRQALVDGAASYRIGQHDEAPLVFAYCCWLDRYSDVCWMIVSRLAQAQGLPPRAGPPAVPWMATLCTPPAGLHAETLGLIRAQEHLVAWALIRP